MSNELANISNIEPLDDYETDGTELSPKYWSPDEAGEVRRMYYLGIAVYKLPSADDPDVIVDLECVTFVDPNGEIVVNGSKRLVGTFEDDKVAQGQPVQITYRGKTKNKSNQKMGDDWSVVKLKRKGS